jgi:shikimate kinase
VITLVGPPGGGKSTIGRVLARQLDLRFIDSDIEIEARIGCSIRHYFEQEGEAAFRAVEQEVIATYAGAEQILLATGGGSVKSRATRQLLKARSTVVYLRCSAEDAMRRLRHDMHRPLLQVPDPLARLRELQRERDPLYRETADFIIETGRLSVSMVVSMVVMQLDLAGIVGRDAAGHVAVNHKSVPALGE